VNGDIQPIIYKYHNRSADGVSFASMAGKSNLELLQRDEHRIDPFLSKWWNPVIASVLGVTTVFVLRYGQRRPLLSGA
jgi:hypothetical protein